MVFCCRNAQFTTRIFRKESLEFRGICLIYRLMFTLKEVDSSRKEVVEEDRRNNKPKLGTSSSVMSYISYYLYWSRLNHQEVVEEDKRNKEPKLDTSSSVLCLISYYLYWRKLNHQEVVEEDRRNKEPKNEEARKRRAEYVLKVNPRNFSFLILIWQHDAQSYAYFQITLSLSISSKGCWLT